MRVAITGATGMIGVALIKACIKQNIEVLAIVRPGSAKAERIPNSPLVGVVEMDLSNLIRVADADSPKCDVFFHLGWGHTERENRNDPAMQDKNISYTLDAVNLSNKLGCKTFVGAGSQAEYGIVAKQITEGTPLNPVTAYGKAKLKACEESLDLCNRLGIKHIWARIFSVYGTLDTPNSMISYATKQFMNGEVAKFSSATQMWNFLFEEDAGEMLLRLGIGEDVAAGVYHVANKESKVLREYIEKMAAIFDAESLCEFESSQNPGQAENVVSLNVDLSKTIKAIDYIPKTSFEDGIRMIRGSKNI